MDLVVDMKTATGHKLKHKATIDVEDGRHSSVYISLLPAPTRWDSLSRETPTMVHQSTLSGAVTLQTQSCSKVTGFTFCIQISTGPI